MVAIFCFFNGRRINNRELKRHFSAGPNIEETLKTTFLVLYSAVFYRVVFWENNNPDKEKHFPLRADQRPRAASISACREKKYMLSEKHIAIGNG
jgi:hypothetical protein